MSAARSFPTFATLLSLGLLSACFGKREEPTIQSLSGNGGGHSVSNGGNGANGGDGGNGAGATDGGGGTTPDGGGGNGGSTNNNGGGGAGGGAQGDGSGLYPLCGCIADFNGPGACKNCIDEATNTAMGMEGSCARIASACENNLKCDQMLGALQLCNPVDQACLDGVAGLDQPDMPLSFDDLVSLMDCACNACQFCDEAACE